MSEHVTSLTGAAAVGVLSCQRASQQEVKIDTVVELAFQTRLQLSKPSFFPT